MKALSNWQNEEEYILANVVVVDPGKNATFPGSVGVKGGRIAFVERGDLPPSTLPVFDGRGWFLSPGFIDIHVHLREPGYEHKEDLCTGTMAAAAGGFTSVACMPNTEPTIDDKSVVDFILRKARISGFARVYPVAAATIGRKGEKLSEFHRLISAGAVAFSDDGSPLSSPQMVRRVLEYASNFGVPVIEHCEDPSTAAGGAMHEGFYSTKLGLSGIPAFSEEVSLARDLLVMRYVSARLHVAHVSTKGSVELVREAKRRGLPVTAETAPHYFSLEDKHLSTYDTNFKVNPPLRSAEDREAVLEGLRDGTIDCIASDHAPHAAEEKEVEFEKAPFGAIGLETAFSVAVKYLVQPGHLSLPETLSLITHRPAAVLGIPGGTLKAGEEADLTIFDPREEWVVRGEDLCSKSRNSPYIGELLYGRVKYTIVGGRVINAASLKGRRAGAEEKTG